MSQDPKETPLAIATPLRAMAQRLQVDEDRITAILTSTVMKPDKNGVVASPEEVLAFAIVANEHQLNPFKKEIYAFSSRGAVVPIVSIDGWSNIVHRNDKFDGCSFEEHEDSDGKVEAITCHMHVKGLDSPVSIKERLNECRRNTEQWKGMPCRMLRHKAFIQAARIAFSLGGIYDEDEGRDQLRNDRPLEPPRRKIVDADVTPEAPPEAAPNDETHPEGDLISESQRRRMFAIAHGAGIKDADLKNRLQDKYGITSSKNITSDVYEEICEWAATPPAPTTSLH